jgi:hypothetical protein
MQFITKTGGLYVVDSSSYSTQYQVAIVPPSQSGNSKIQTFKNFSGFNLVLDLQPAGGTIKLEGKTTAKSDLNVVGIFTGNASVLTNFNYNAITNKPDLSRYAKTYI